MKVSLGRDTSGRALILDDTSVAKLRAAEARLNFKFTIVQGSYRGSNGAAASAGTHDAGGVFDLRTWNIPPSIGVNKAVRVLRECGLIAWHRTRAQGFDDHIHAIDYGNRNLSPSAARQVVAWENGRNGLANNGPDDGPRIPIPKTAPIAKDWFDMADKADLQAAIKAEIPDIAKAVLAQTVTHRGDDGKTSEITVEKALEWEALRSQRIEEKLDRLLGKD